MKLSYIRGELADGLARLSSFTKTSRSQQLYLFTSRSITASNPEANATFDCVSGADVGQFTISASAIAPFLSGPSDGAISIRLDGTNVTIASGTAKLVAPTVQDSPVVAMDAGQREWVECEGDALSAAVKAGGLWCGTHNHHKEFNYMLFTAFEGGLLAASTNRNCISMDLMRVAAPPNSISLIPYPMARMMSAASGPSSISTDGSLVSLKAQSATFHHNLFNGNPFPAIALAKKARAVPLVAVVEKAGLLGMLRTAAACVPAGHPCKLDISIAGNQLKVDNSSAEGQFEAGMECEQSGGDVAFTCDPSYLSSMVEATPSDRVSIHTTNDRADAVVVTPEKMEWPLHVAAKMHRG